MSSSGHGGGSRADVTAAIAEELAAARSRAWTRLSADIAARVLGGADSPTARPG